MKMILLPDDMYALSLASCDFEELCFIIEDRLRQARVPVLPGVLRKNVSTLAKKIWNLEVEASPVRDRHIHQARLSVTKCATNIEAISRTLKSTGELCRQGMTLLLTMMNELEGLRLHGPAKKKPSPRLLN